MAVYETVVRVKDIRVEERLVIEPGVFRGGQVADEYTVSVESLGRPHFWTYFRPTAEAAKRLHIGQRLRVCIEPTAEGSGTAPR